MAEGLGGSVFRPSASDHDTPLTLGFGFPGPDMPGKVLNVKSQESGEAEGYCIGSWGAFQVVTRESPSTTAHEMTSPGYVHVEYGHMTLGTGTERLA